MKNAALVVLIVLAAMFMGCGGSNGVWPDLTGQWDVDFTVAWNDATLADGIDLRVEGEGMPQEIPVTDGKVTAEKLDRGIDYRFSFINEEGEEIELQLGDQIKTFFTMSLAEEEDPANLQVPEFTLLRKPVPTVLVLNITPITSEAEVWVDGDSLGSANANGYFETTIDPGNHEITLIGWGCEEKRGSIAIESGETKTLNIQLKVWDLTGKWKRESDDKEVHVAMIEYPLDPWQGKPAVKGFNPVGVFVIKGNGLYFKNPSTTASGQILENGKRIEFTAYSQYGNSSYIYTKMF